MCSVCMYGNALCGVMCTVPLRTSHVCLTPKPTVVDQRGIVTDWFPVITAALCKLGEEQSERIFSFSRRPKAGRTFSRRLLWLCMACCMMHDGMSSSGFCPRRACRRRLVGGGLSSAGFFVGGLVLGSLGFGSLVLGGLVISGLVLGGLVLEGLSSTGLHQLACRHSLDIGRLEDGRLVIGGLVLGRLVVGRLVISGLVLGLTSAGWARSSSSSESRPVGQCGITVVDRRGIFVQAQQRGYRRRVTYAGACEKPPTLPSLGRSRPLSASKRKERERPSSAESDLAFSLEHKPESTLSARATRRTTVVWPQTST